MLKFTASLALVLFSMAQVARADNWGHWRGPTGNGSAEDASPPTEWSDRKNVKWKVAIPGRGHSSPVIWGDRVFLGTCLPGKEQRVLLCLDRRNGRELWRRVVVKSGLETAHRLNSRASGTPASGSAYSRAPQVAPRRAPGAPERGSAYSPAP